LRRVTPTGGPNDSSSIVEDATMHSLREPDQKTDQLAHVVIGAAIEVHRHLGPGFLESVYERALHVELKLRRIPFEPQKSIPVEYKGVTVGKPQPDLLVDDRLVVELKAAKAVAPIDRAKVISYLKASGRQLALLINFNVSVLRDGVQRIVLS
jgi:GxxExxY protein